MRLLPRFGTLPRHALMRTMPQPRAPFKQRARKQGSQCGDPPRPRPITSLSEGDQARLRRASAIAVTEMRLLSLPFTSIRFVRLARSGARGQASSTVTPSSHLSSSLSVCRTRWRPSVLGTASRSHSIFTAKRRHMSLTTSNIEGGWHPQNVRTCLYSMLMTGVICCGQ